MRSIEQLTLYAYGLLDATEDEDLGHHVEACAACGDVVRRLRVEQTVLRRAASRGTAPEAPAELLARRVDRPRASFRLAGLAAAALLGVLVWFLSRPFEGGKDPELHPYAQSSAEDLDRLVAELKSPSPVRREIAALALESYGNIAVEKLETAGADPALIDSCRGITRADRAVLNKLKETRVTIDMENSSLPTIIDYIRDVSGLSFHISGIPNPESEKVSFKVNDIVIDGALRLMLQPRQKTYRVRGGIVLITTEDQAKAMDQAPLLRLPVRIPQDAAAIRRRITELSTGTPQERDRATEALGRLGFAAERALWDALDSEVSEVRTRSRALLRQLYTTPEAPPASPAEQVLEGTKVDLSMENGPLSEILIYLGKLLRLPIAATPSFQELDRRVTFKMKDLNGKNTLKLLLSQFGKDYLILDGVILLLDPREPVFRAPSTPLWTSPEEAKGIETRLLRIAAGEKVDVRKECGSGDIPALLQAWRALDGAAADRCRRAAVTLVEEAHGWLPDSPSGAELQKLTNRQLTILSTECKPAADDTLESLLLRSHVKYSLKAGSDGPVHVYGTGLPLRRLLKVLTRPTGRDFYLDGETIVIDTADAVREQVEK